jgi:hypothetical protein
MVVVAQGVLELTLTVRRLTVPEHQVLSVVQVEEVAVVAVSQAVLVLTELSLFGNLKCIYHGFRQYIVCGHVCYLVGEY